MTTSRLEVVDLLQQMIRNECVNDGSDASGHETRTADLLMSELEGSGADFAIYEPTPGRSSLVGGSRGATRTPRRSAGSATPMSCRRTRTGGRGIPSAASSSTARCGAAGGGHVEPDGIDVGRLRQAGAKRLPAEGNTRARRRRRRGGPRIHGAGWLAEHETDAVKCDYVITETGGIPLEGPSGKRLPVMVGEKGSCWCRLRVHGEAGHASNLCAPTTPS